MRKMKKFLTLAITAALLSSSMTVNAAEVSITAKENADYMMSINRDGVPNWFNGTYYGDSYADLKNAFNTNEKALYEHSLEYGFDETRLVTPVLDVVKYRDYYPDLDKAFGDNWTSYVKHYFEYGIAEGRNNFTDFEAKTYLNMYEDLQEAFGTDLGLATRHYIEFGIAEGRAYKLPEPKIVLEETDNDNEDDNNLSDSGSSDSDNTEENFTGDKRVELTDNMYAIETYVNNVLTTVTIYNSDGTEESKTTYTYDENTILKSSKSSYEDGSMEEITYYETGYYKANTFYRADGTKSSYMEYNEQGDTTIVIDYQADGTTEETNTKIVYDENGNMTSEQTTWADGSSCEITYENGVRTYQVDIHTDGTKVEAEYYEDGSAIKKQTEFCTDGTKYIVEIWENGNLKTCTWYDASGNITRKQEYSEEGELTSDEGYTIATPAE